MKSCDCFGASSQLAIDLRTSLSTCRWMLFPDETLRVADRQGSVFDCWERSTQACQENNELPVTLAGSAPTTVVRPVASRISFPVSAFEPSDLSVPSSR